MKLSRQSKRIFTLLAFILFALLVYRFAFPCNKNDYIHLYISKQLSTIDQNGKTYSYDNNIPLIFIGGVPRSGTTLMRAMLDAHPDIRCGEETRVIPRLLQMRGHWVNSKKEKTRLEEAGINSEVLNAAISAFVLEIIVKHGEPAHRLCNKDPFTLKSASYLSEIFPSAKFIFMVRDGRATVHSIISRKVTISGFDLTSYRQCITKWNTAIHTMWNECRKVGSYRCLPVPYEQLVLQPRVWLKKILDFLNLQWDEAVLHHEELINRPGGVSLSKVERSSDQVVKPINVEALSKWVGQIPEDVVNDMAELAPMLEVLGYDPMANPPNYGMPDPEVQRKTLELHENESTWKNRADEVLKHSKNSNIIDIHPGHVGQPADKALPGFIDVKKVAEPDVLPNRALGASSAYANKVIGDFDDEMQEKDVETLRRRAERGASFEERRHAEPDVVEHVDIGENGRRRAERGVSGEESLAFGEHQPIAFNDNDLQNLLS